MVRVQGLNQDVAGHDGGTAGRDERAERNQFARIQRRGVGRDPREGQMRIGGCVAVAREVLGARCHAGVFESTDPGGSMPGHQVRFGAEAAHADHGIVRSGIDVGIRSQVEVDAQAC